MIFDWVGFEGGTYISSVGWVQVGQSNRERHREREREREIFPFSNNLGVIDYFIFLCKFRETKRLDQ